MRTPAIEFLAIILGLLWVVSGEVTYAQTKPPGVGTKQSSGKTLSAKDEEDLAAQRERLELDKKKFASDREKEGKELEIEKAKLEVEQSKVPWSAASTIVPLLAALFTIGYSVWSFRKQNTLQSEAQKAAAKLDFEIKAAEIAFAGKSPQAVQNRGGTLKEMFGDRLPDKFPGSFDPKLYGGDKEDPEGKKLLLELLLKYPDKKEDILKYWDQLFPGDYQWLERVTRDAGPREPRVASASSDKVTGGSEK
jgi:hypothetical protein